MVPKRTLPTVPPKPSYVLMVMVMVMDHLHFSYCAYVCLQEKYGSFHVPGN